jgi:hypothetical protein
MIVSISDVVLEKISPHIEVLSLYIATPELVYSAEVVAAGKTAGAEVEMKDRSLCNTLVTMDVSVGAP